MLEKIHLIKSAHPGRNKICEYLTRQYGSLPGFATYNSYAPATPDSEKCTYVFLAPLVSISACSEGEQYLTTGTQSVRPLWTALDRTLNDLLKCQQTFNVPCCAGFLSYELGGLVEKFQPAAQTAFNLPLYHFYIYSQVLKIPKQTELPVQLYNLVYDESCINTKQPLWTTELEAELNKLLLNKVPEAVYPTTMPLPSLEEVYCFLRPFSNFSQASYLQAIEAIHSLIRQGDVYQINLTQLFSLPPPSDPASFMAALQSNQVAAQGAYFSFPTPGQENNCTTIVSESPETFFKLNRREIICSPIKGTRARADGISDQQTIAGLTAASKDAAELTMIVDLIRNDLGRISEIGSVQVREHARVQALPHAYHLVSDIVGRLPEEITLAQIIRALFPSGSITGAPKISAMHQISKLEGVTRGVYTGSLGIIGPNDQAEFNVAIRTVTCDAAGLHFQTGGGVVIDSDAEAEFMETLIKARNIVRAYWLACNDSTLSDSSLAAAVSIDEA